MTTTEHTVARAIAFTFNDSRTDHPVDVLSDVGDALCALSDLFVQDDIELSPRGAGGIYKILRGCIATLDALQTPIQEKYSDPVGTRFREALPLMDQEYRRGLREGAMALVRGVERSNAPELARMIQAWVGDDILDLGASPTAAPTNAPARPAPAGGGTEESRGVAGSAAPSRRVWTRRIKPARFTGLG